MFLKNPYYSCVDLYVKEINSHLEQGKLINLSCKSYDKSKDNFINFYCFDLKSDIKITESLLFKEIKYNGNLVFSYNKATDEVYISELPYIDFGKNKIYVFTNDIAKIVVDKLSNYVPSSDIKITFNSNLLLIAMDKKVPEVIPDITNTRNYKFLNEIMKQIKKEEDKIIADTIRYKAKSEREEKARQRAIRQKRKMYGVAPDDFSNYEEFQDNLNKLLIEIWQKKVANIKRHLEANIKAYNNLVLSLEPNIIEDVFKYVIQVQRWAHRIKDEKTRIGDEKAYSSLKKYLEKDIKTLTEEEKEEILNTLLEFDLDLEYGALSKIFFVRNICIPYIKSFKHNIYVDHIEWEYMEELLYTEFAYGIKKGDKNFEFYYPLDENHPIFGKEQFSYYGEENRCLERFAYNDTTQKGIDLLLQINSLKQQLYNYTYKIKCPQLSILQFHKHSNLWGAITEFPYWIREGVDPYFNGDHETYLLLMIKKGIQEIDLTDIRCFREQKAHSHHFIGKQQFDKIIVFIPSSLNYNEVNKIISYAHSKAKQLKFVCETVETAIIAKKILVFKELNMRKKGERYLTKYCYVSVDPTYYDSFLVDTPSNVTLWHRYDYSSNYKFHRPTPLSLDGQISEALNLVGDKENNFKIVEELLFGSYSSLEYEELYQEYQKRINEIETQIKNGLKQKRKTKRRRI